MEFPSRREFLSFLGRTTLGVETALLLLERGISLGAEPVPFSPIGPSDKDSLLLAEGFDYHSVLKWGDRLNAKGETFGVSNDYIGFFPLESSKDGLLWVNHEYPEPRALVSGYEEGKERTEAQVKKEQAAVGGTIARVRQDANGQWKLVADDPRNRRLDALTEIPFAWPEAIAGSKAAVGTFANCAGGMTPWGTALTCEENYQDYYGEIGRNGERLPGESTYGWEKYQKRPPQHYGWVVEVSPRTGAAKKLVALGRFGHEGALVVTASDGRVAVYMGDDAEDRCLYKFVSEKAGSLERGTLYVADTKNGRWIALDREKHPALKKEFKTQTELLVHTRIAAELAGGTPLHRPEGMAQDPLTKAIYAALTNSAKRGDPFGSIVKLVEKKNDPIAIEFEYSTFLTGGAKTGFACPDNLTFDRRGNLWVACDISGKLIGKGEYAPFANNGLFYVPTTGANAGKVFQVASAPKDAEFTGPLFTQDGTTLFLSVQHPGELSTKSALTSHWPDGGNSMPRSAVVAVTSKLFHPLVR